MPLYSYQKSLGVKNFRFGVSWLKGVSFLSLSLGLGVLFYLAISLTPAIFSFRKTVPLSLISARNVSLLGKEAQVLGLRDYPIWDRFYLSIPKLGIEKALVTTDVASDKKEVYFPILNYSLAHYKGSSYPIEAGDVFIYGHSVLPEFFNPKNYLTIFSKLHELEGGDEIDIYWGGEKLVYLVVDSQVVGPEELNQINLKKEGEKTLTLMTCNPPGTYLKRLLVRARLVS